MHGTESRTNTTLHSFEHGGFTHTTTLFGVTAYGTVGGVKVGVVEEKSTFAKDQGENEW